MTEEQTKPITHKELVRRAVAWLRYAQKCGVVLAELRTQNTETPDALGFHGAGGSILIECKVSRADFLADQNKIFRRCAEIGMGDQRYFMMPKGLIVPAETPPGWGLLEVTPCQIRIAMPAGHKHANKRAEVAMLTSVIRRLELSTAVFVQPEPLLEEATP